jgi:hypothetical protein
MTFAEFAIVAPKVAVKTLLTRVAERQNDRCAPIDPDGALRTAQIEQSDGQWQALVHVTYQSQECFRYVPKFKGWV